MATSSLSFGGAIDVNAIVSQLMSIERQPLSLINTKKQGIDTKLTEVGRLKSAMDALRSASTALSGLDSWSASRATSSVPEAVQASAARGALPGSYALKVNTLAQHQTLVTPAVEDGDALVGGGSLSIQFGSGDGGAFVADPDRAAIDITIPSGATLSQVRDAINAADAGIGASLITDATGTRLMIRSEESGELQGFSIGVTDDGSGDGGLGLASLSYAPGDTGGGVERLQQAGNASVELNGLALSLTSNDANEMIENVSFSFRKQTATPVDIDIVSDGESLREGIDKFVTAYNELNSLIRSQTTYDAGSQSGGPLQSNRAVLSVQSRMREIIGATVGGLDLNRLSAVGIEIQRDGSLLVADDKLNLAIENPKALDALFGARDPDVPGNVGIAKRLEQMLDDMLGTDGAISGATESLQSRREIYEEKEDRLNSRLTLIEARLIRQYSALDANLAQLNGSLNSISQLNNNQ